MMMRRREGNGDAFAGAYLFCCVSYEEEEE